MLSDIEKRREAGREAAQHATENDIKYWRGLHTASLGKPSHLEEVVKDLEKRPYDLHTLNQLRPTVVNNHVDLPPPKIDIHLKQPALNLRQGEILQAPAPADIQTPRHHYSGDEAHPNQYVIHEGNGVDSASDQILTSFVIDELAAVVSAEKNTNKSQVPVGYVLNKVADKVKSNKDMWARMKGRDPAAFTMTLLQKAHPGKAFESFVFRATGDEGVVSQNTDRIDPQPVLPPDGKNIVARDISEQEQVPIKSEEAKDAHPTLNWSVKQQDLNVQPSIHDISGKSKPSQDAQTSLPDAKSTLDNAHEARSASQSLPKEVDPQVGYQSTNPGDNVKQWSPENGNVQPSVPQNQMPARDPPKEPISKWGAVLRRWGGKKNAQTSKSEIQAVESPLTLGRQMTSTGGFSEAVLPEQNTKAEQSTQVQSTSTTGATQSTTNDTPIGTLNRQPLNKQSAFTSGDFGQNAPRSAHQEILHGQQAMPANNPPNNAGQQSLQQQNANLPTDPTIKSYKQPEINNSTSLYRQPGYDEARDIYHESVNNNAAMHSSYQPTNERAPNLYPPAENKNPMESRYQQGIQPPESQRYYNSAGTRGVGNPAMSQYPSNHNNMYAGEGEQWRQPYVTNSQDQQASYAQQPLGYPGPATQAAPQESYSQRDMQGQQPLYGGNNIGSSGPTMHPTDRGIDSNQRGFSPNAQDYSQDSFSDATQQSQGPSPYGDGGPSEGNDQGPNSKSMPAQTGEPDRNGASAALDPFGDGDATENGGEPYGEQEAHGDHDAGKFLKSREHSMSDGYPSDPDYSSTYSIPETQPEPDTSENNMTSEPGNDNFAQGRGSPSEKKGTSNSTSPEAKARYADDNQIEQSGISEDASESPGPTPGAPVVQGTYPGTSSPGTSSPVVSDSGSEKGLGILNDASTASSSTFSSPQSFAFSKAESTASSSTPQSQPSISPLPQLQQQVNTLKRKLPLPPLKRPDPEWELNQGHWN